MNSFLQSLHAEGPAAEYADKLMLYGQFIGQWDAEGQAFLSDGAVRRHYWQIRFGWILEGRAVQDVWITPPRAGSRVGHSEPWGPFTNQYGTTIRVYDPKIDAWRVTWIDPCTGYRADLVGRVRDGEIFQEGIGSDGARVRWIFSEINRGAFRWRAELSRDDGASWHKALELLAARA
jgi:hypothetical protein